jgi:nitrogen fixation protein FixH
VTALRKLPPHIVWPGVVIALLCMSVTMVTVTIIAALDDPSFAVEPDYYEQGLRWDDHKAQLEHNRALGWQASVEVGEPDALQRRPLIVTLVDTDGAAIEGAVVEASCFHHAAAHRVEALTLVAGDAPGEYRASAGIDREGLWEVTLAVSAHGERFTDRRTLDLAW